MVLTPQYIKRSAKLIYHEKQDALLQDTYDINVRHCISPSGRRSGKTEVVGKRRLVARAVVGVPVTNPRYFVAAPTRDQVKKIYWNDLKVLTQPFRKKRKTPSESSLIIYLDHDREIHLLGMDKPERIEGSHWDGGVLDEYGNMKKKAWEEHVRPALSTPGRPLAWCDFIGVPEGRNHYYDLYREAKAQMLDLGDKSPWGVYHWHSADVVDPKEIEQAKREMDELTFKQEYEGDFISHFGKAYYNFHEDESCLKLPYFDDGDLHLCFDFNVAPGIAVAIQEFEYGDRVVDGVVGEVYIQKNSNTERVAKKVVEKYGKHKGNVYLYGDSTGGAKQTSQKDDKTDWIIIEDILNPVFGEQRIYNEVPKANPRVKDRLNSLNSRLKNTLGERNFFVDPTAAPETLKDFEGVEIIEGTAGEIDKSNPKFTHLTDAIGYCISERYPLKRLIGGSYEFTGF